VILDTSAIVGVVLREPGFEDLVRKVAQAEALGVGAPTLVEAGLVLTSRLGRDARGLLRGLLHEWGAVTITFGEDHWQAAVAAYVRYGRGRHAARLNFGDCMAYAVAHLAREPLLCTGGDFPRTDIAVA